MELSVRIRRHLFCSLSSNIDHRRHITQHLLCVLPFGQIYYYSQEVEGQQFTVAPSQCTYMLTIYSNFFNKDFSLDLVGKHIKIFTVILESILEGSMSHYFDLCLCSFFYVMQKKGEGYFLQFVMFHMIKK